MKGILKMILLSREVAIDLPYENVLHAISKMDEKDFGSEQIGPGIYKFLANFSMGTAMVRGIPARIEGIKVFAEVTKKIIHTLHQGV